MHDPYATPPLLDTTYRQHAIVRPAIALVVAATCGWFGGRIVIAGGFGGWIILLLMVPATTSIVCLISGTKYWQFGFLYSTVLATSLLFENSTLRGYTAFTTDWFEFVGRNAGTVLTTSIITCLLSLIASIPISRAKCG